MKGRKIYFFIFVMGLFLLMGCSNKRAVSVDMDKFEAPNKPFGQIHFYGEIHAVEKILDKEFDLWYEYYHNQDMRHLFVELPYYTAAFLNIWMGSDHDEILDEIHNDSVGTLSYSPSVKEFYKKIKNQCPETIFHGTDIGHQHDTTGARFLEYLKVKGLENSKSHILAKEAIEQGLIYYSGSDDVYRENMMVENFIREFDGLENENIMGIYGAAHTGINELNFFGNVETMANQLEKRYGKNIHSVDLSYLSKEIEPYKVESISLFGKDYRVLYFGKEDLVGFQDYAYREYWRIENAYEDFKKNKKVKNVLPYDAYPMTIKEGDVFIVDSVKIDGSKVRRYYRSDGEQWKGKDATTEFKLE